MKAAPKIRGLAARRASRAAAPGRAWRLAALGTALACAPTWAVQPAAAQVWAVVALADTLARVEAAAAEAAARAALDLLAQDGRPGARADSAGPDPSGTPVVWVTPGPQAVVASVRVLGAVARPDALAGWQTRAGAPFRPSALRADLETSAGRYAEAGFLAARLTPRLALVPGDGLLRVEVTVEVSEGAEAVLAGVELAGSDRPARAFASRVAGVAPGTRLRAVDPRAVRRDLLATGLYRSVGTPEVVLEADGRAVLRVPVVDGPPGFVDAVVGYLPPSGGARGQLVGSGRVELRNLFGGGRTARAELERTPGLGSAVSLAVGEPFVLGLPVRVGLAFDGLARDSTFSRQAGRAEAGLRVAPGLEATLSLAREAVSPGRFGAAAVGGVPRVRRSVATFGGAGVRLSRLDAPLAPRRGLALAVGVETGLRRRSLAPSDTSDANARAQRQQRLTAGVRGYVPATARLGAVFGLDARVLLSGRDAGGETAAVYDEGELFRLGGAASLRGYDEDAFTGNAVGRAFAEGHVRLDAGSTAFAFFDLGAVGRPALASGTSERRLLPGYGVGTRLATALGLASVTFALRPDVPLGRGRLHVGLGVGL